MLGKVTTRVLLVGSLLFFSCIVTCHEIQASIRCFTVPSLRHEVSGSQLEVGSHFFKSFKVDCKNMTELKKHVRAVTRCNASTESLHKTLYELMMKLASVKSDVHDYGATLSHLTRINMGLACIRTCRGVLREHFNHVQHHAPGRGSFCEIEIDHHGISSTDLQHFSFDSDSRKLEVKYGHISRGYHHFAEFESDLNSFSKVYLPQVLLDIVHFSLRTNLTRHHVKKGEAERGRRSDSTKHLVDRTPHFPKLVHPNDQAETPLSKDVAIETRNEDDSTENDNSLMEICDLKGLLDYYRILGNSGNSSKIPCYFFMIIIILGAVGLFIYYWIKEKPKIVMAW